MGHKKYPLDLVYTLAAETGSNDVEMDQVESGLLYCIQRVVVENETSDTTDVRILKAGVGETLPLEEKDTLAAATLYWTSEPFYLHEGQRVIGRFTGCTAGDRLRMAIFGWFAKF